MADDFTAKSYLVIDDFADMRAAIRSILASLGISRIDQARNGSDAITQMQDKRYDVVLCDYHLGPGKDGQQVLEEARHRSLIGVDCIFIMITAENTREMVMGAAEYAPDSYLAKPFTKDLLRTRLSKLCERKAHLTKVNQALMANDYAAAIRELNTLIAAQPKNLTDLLKLKAETCITANRLDEAMAIFDQVLADREISWARLGAGKVLFARKHYAQAQEIFRHLIDADPNLITAHDWLAKTQTAQNLVAEAEQTLSAAVKLSPRGLKRQQMLGDMAASNGNHQVAEAAFERAVVLAKHSVLNHPSLFAGLARAKSANNKPAEAMKVVGEIAKVFPEQPEAAFFSASTTALIKNRQGDAEGAKAALEAAERSLAQLAEATHAAPLMLEMAKTYATLGEHEKATQLLRKTIADNHDEDEVLTEILQVCRGAGLEYDVESAIREIQLGVVKTNNEGVRLIKQGQFEAAIRLLSGAADDMAGNKTINLNAAKAIIMKMEKLGATEMDIQTVRRYVDRVQSLAADDWRLSDVITRLRKLATRS